MAKALANLNVRLGFIFDTKSLAAVEKQLQRTGQRLAKTGQDISLFISAPLALMGAGAIKAAGEFESLSLAMQATFRNAGRTVAEANAEVEALRKAALAPGLDFQQAVSASIRLQSVGLNAEQARATIQELANAIASTGGTAENLSGVTVQMAQMISKGRVLAGDLRIIQENLPIISDLMLKAFGTSNSEDIQKLGITGREFVEGVTAEMTKLSRVQGGISNALVNAGSAIKQFLAGVGAEIARVFNITSLSDQFAAALSSITEGFKGLSDGTKKFIVIAGALLVAIGPIIAIMGAASSVTGTLVAGYRTAITPISQFAEGFNKVKNAVALATAQEVLATKALEASKEATILATAVQSEAVGAKKKAAAATALLKAQEVEAAAASRLLSAQNAVTAATTATSATSFTKATTAIASGIRSMSLASKAFLGIGIAFAVYEIAQSFLEYSHNLSTAEKVQRTLNDVQKEAASAIASEKTEVNTLIAVINSEVSSREAKVRALDKLKSISPEYFGQLKVENGLVNGLTASYDKYVAALLNSARAEAAKGKLVEIERQLLDLEDQRAAKLEEGRKAAAFVGVSAAQVNEREAAAYKKQIEELDAKRTALTAVVVQSEANNASTVKGTDATVKNTTATGKAAYTKKELAAAEKDRLKGLKDIAEAEYAQASRLEAAKTIVDAVAASYKAMDQAALDAANADAEARQASIGAVDTSFNGPTDGGQALAGGGNAAITQAAPLDLGINLDGVTAATEALQFMRDTMAGLNEGTVSFGQTFDAVVKNFESNASLLQASALAIAQGVSQFAEQGGSSLKGFAVEAAQSAARVVRSFIMEGVAAAAAKALTSVPFPFNIAAGGIAGALAGTLFNKLIQSIGLPQFARGTNDAPGGLSLVGEKGPELINLPRHSKVFPAHETSSMLKGVGGQNINMSGEFRVKGTDLVFVMEQVQAKQKRQR